MILIHWFDSAN